MIPDEIRSIVLASEELKSLAREGRDGDLAKHPDLSESVGIEYRLTSRGVNDLFGLLRGAAVMAALRAKAQEATPTGVLISEMLSLMDIRQIGENQGVDLNHADAPTLIELLVSEGIITSDEASLVLGKARTQRQPSVDEVSAALAEYRPNGQVGGEL